MVVEIVHAPVAGPTVLGSVGHVGLTDLAIVFILFDGKENPNTLYACVTYLFWVAYLYSKIVGSVGSLFVASVAKYTTHASSRL